MVRKAMGGYGAKGDREALAAVTAAADASDFETLVGMLDDPSGAVARAAAVALASSGPGAVEPLIRALYSRSPGSLMAERCLVALGPCCSRAVVDEAVETEDDRVRAALLSVLGSACDVASFGWLLETAIAGGDIFAARSAATAIARLGSDLPIELLERALTEPAQEVLSSAAASALSSRGEDGESVLLSALKASRVRTALIANRALERVGRAAASGASGKAAGHSAAASMGPDRALLEAARLARARACEKLSETLDPLLPLFNPLGAASDVGLLAECGPPAVDSLELAAMTCAHAREIAARALIDINTPDSVYTLRYLLQDEYLPVRLATACALGSRGRDKAIATLEEILQAGDVISKCRAAKALSGIADRRCYDLLMGASRDPDARVRLAARRALARTWPARCPDLLELELVTRRPDRPSRFKLSEEELSMEVDRLTSESAAVRLAAVRNLGAIGDSEAAVPLANALLDPDDRVALEARIAIDRLEV